MNLSNVIRQHWAALRALLVLTAITGLAYPLVVWAVALLPGFDHRAQGSIITVGGKPVGSTLIGQSFTDASGSPLPQYFQSRPSAAGDGYDPLATSASNLGPEDVVDTPDKPSLLTLVCSRSAAVGALEGVDGSRPFCTGDGVGAVLSVIGPRDARGTVVRPTQVVSLNQSCTTTTTPFLDVYEGVRVTCATYGEDYSMGQIVPVRGAAPVQPAVPADAVTASGSGLDPHISPPTPTSRSHASRRRAASSRTRCVTCSPTTSLGAPWGSWASRRSTCSSSISRSIRSIPQGAERAGG